MAGRGFLGARRKRAYRRDGAAPGRDGHHDEHPLAVQRRLRRGGAQAVLDQERQALEKQQEFCRRLFEAGGLIVGGTDAAINYPPPGFSLMRELELLAEAIGAMNALRAVTSKAAIALRKQDDIGAVAPGRFADL